MKKINRLPCWLLFLCFCLTFTAINANITTYSHVDAKGRPLDHKLLKILKRKPATFIEAGANNGILQSNTKLLESNFGWTGICIEPSRNIFAELVANRPNSKCFNCALGSFEEEGMYIKGDFNGHLMSSVDGLRLGVEATDSVLVRSLQSILDEVGLQHIRFFSLDVEGYELNVLKGIDFNKIVFDYLLIEIYPAEKDEVIDFLKLRQYELIDAEFSGYNLIDNPGWDGTHNDYLFKRKGVI